MFVIKFVVKNCPWIQLYWYGDNTIGEQLRKAVIYKTVKTADSVAKDCLNRPLKQEGYKGEVNHEGLSYRIVEVELREKY